MDLESVGKSLVTVISSYVDSGKEIVTIYLQIVTLEKEH